MTYPKINERWRIGNAIFRIRNIDEDKQLLWVELQPTRSIRPVALCDWLECDPELCSEELP